MDANKSTPNQRVELKTKMTPEICRAIKRQETNLGLDYWRTGLNKVKVSSDNTGLQAKRPTYRSLAQVNFDFPTCPGLFLPNVDTQSLRQKRKDSKGLPIVLNRTKTSMIPEIKTGHMSSARQKSDNHNPSRKAAVTDLTCLQLADTLLSYNSPFSGVYGTSTVRVYNTLPIRSRNAELFSSDKNGEDREERESNSFKVTNKNETEEEKSISRLSYHTFNPEGKDSNAEDQCVIASSCTSGLPVVDIDANTKPLIRPQKSILKNGFNKVRRPSSETAISHAYSASAKPSVCSYQLPRTKTHLRSVSETRLPTCSLYPKIQNDLRDFGHFYGCRNVPVTGAIRNIPVKLEKEHLHSDLATRKRSVRFNAAHEVREYAPCEPISFC